MHYIEPELNWKQVLFFQEEEEEEDLFKIQQAPLEPASCYHHRDHQMKKGMRGEKQQRKKQGRRVCYGNIIRTPKAVDEDLYKIPPPELLYQIPKSKRLGNFLSGCLRPQLHCLNQHD